MKIAFYEEFPTKQNLQKLKLIKFPTRLILAAKSLQDFRKLETKVKSKYVKELSYWPTLPVKDGYWPSPFADTEALFSLIKELESNTRNLKLMWDAELPMLSKKLFIAQLPHFLRHKKMIKGFLKNAHNYGIELETSEYEFDGVIMHSLMKFACLTFNAEDFKHRKIGMFYTSFVKNKFEEEYLEKQLDNSRKKYGSDFSVGLGVIAPGVGEKERILSPAELERDLKVLQKHKVEEAVIFRLGGLNKDYVSVISKFLH